MKTWTTILATVLGAAVGIFAQPPVPTLTTPTQNATDVPVSTSLTWSASTGATSYWVELSTDPAFATTLISESIVAATRAVGPLANSTVYYWRVNAMDSIASGYSTVGSFTTVIAAPPPPTLNTPAQNATNVPFISSLAWSVSAGAASYRVQVSTDAAFTTTVVDTSVTATTLAVGPLASNAVHFWRVSASNTGGTSGYSAISNFTTAVAIPATPTLTSPADSAANVAVSLTLTWSVRAGATYRLQLSTDSTFATTLVDDSTLTANTRVVGPLANSTLHFWRVNASNAGGTSAYSTIWRFTTIIAVPPAPVLASPAQIATGIPEATSLTWAASTGAATYRVQLSTDSTFATTLVNDSTVTATTLAVGPLASNAVHFWRVNANNVGGSSAFSATQSFTTRLAAPILSSPAQNAPILATSVNLTWNASPSATSYRVQLSYNSTFTNLALNDSTVTATTRNYANLTYGIVYYWRVSAKNAGGTSTYSTTGIFNTGGVGILPKEISLQRLTLGRDQAFRFSLPQKERVVIQVFNSQGRMVSQLMNETRDAGSYAVPLSSDLNGSSYFLDFKAGNFHQTLKLNR